MRRLFAIRMDAEAECRKLRIEECYILISKYCRQFVRNVDEVVHMRDDKTEGNLILESEGKKTYWKTKTKM